MFKVSDGDRLCQECFSLVAREATNRMEFPDHQGGRQVGHTSVCIRCGISLSSRTGRRRHSLLGASNERSYIENEIFPRQVSHLYHLLTGS